MTTRTPARPRPQRHRPGMQPAKAAVTPVPKSVPQRLTVKLGGPLQSAAGGQTVFEVEASTILEMLRKLGQTYPQLQPVLARSVTVVVDGQVYRGDWHRAVKAGSEIYLLPPMQGG